MEQRAKRKQPEKLMSKLLVNVALGALLFALSFSVEAQQPKSGSRIGYLSVLSPSSDSARIGAFRQGLRELGYVEGQNIFIEARYAQGKLDQLPDLAGELVRTNVDVIVVGGSTATRAAKNATKLIPIVMAHGSDPVALGYVASLARPGGNITGLTTWRRSWGENA
jgi:putative ABC transport system substrate-binding protein